MTGAINSGEMDILLRSNLPSLSPGDQGLLPMPSIPMPSIRMPGMPMPSIPMPGMPMPGMDPPPPPGWLPMPPSPSQFPIGAQGSSRFGTSPADGSVLFQLPADLQGARASADLQRPLWRGVLESAERLTQLLESARVQQPPLAETDLIAQIQSLVAVFVRVPRPAQRPTLPPRIGPPRAASDDLLELPLMTSDDL